MAPRYGSKEWPYVWPLKKDIVGGQEGWVDPRSPNVPKLLPTKLGRIEGELDIRNLHRQNLAKDKANQAWFRNTVKSDGGPEAMRSRLRENTRLLKEQKRLQNWEKDWSLLNQNQIAELQSVNTKDAPKRITNKEAESLFQNEEQQFVDKSGIKGAGETDQVRATDPVTPSSANEQELITNDLNNNDDVAEVEARSKTDEQVQNDGNQSIIELPDEKKIIDNADQVSLPNNKIPEITGGSKDSEPPKAEKKDGPFSTAADTFNTVNSMIKGLSTIMANMNPDAQSASFADPTDYFKNKKALEDWRRKMYGSQVRA